MKVRRYSEPQRAEYSILHGPKCHSQCPHVILPQAHQPLSSVLAICFSQEALRKPESWRQDCQHHLAAR